ncbi:MAG TPA: hypothetical protein VHK90_08590 [Thermoanaerobaculia bacterium]|nr:hypothetical protein [Thermoanaerobaculia bacterium]
MTLFASLTATADVRIAVDPRPNEWIGASVVAVDGSGAVVMTSGSPRVSRLIRFDARGNKSETRIDGISVNALQPAGNDRFFIRGAIGSGADARYVARLIRLTNGSLVTLWDSATLGSRVTRNEDAVVTLDPTGEWWSALVPSSSRRFAVLFGKTSAEDATMTYHVENETRFVNAPPAGFTGGSWELVSLGGTHAAALTPQGSVYIVSADDGVKTILSPERGGGHLEWDAATQTLWVESGKTWTAFALQDTLARRKEKTAKPGTTHASATTSQRPGPARPAGLPPGATVSVSPGGRAMLILPSGPRSREVIVRME